jgi:hypothetical protein
LLSDEKIIQNKIREKTVKQNVEIDLHLQKLAPEPLHWRELGS